MLTTVSTSADADNEDIADADNFTAVDTLIKALSDYVNVDDIPEADRKEVTQADIDKVAEDLITALSGHVVHTVKK